MTIALVGDGSDTAEKIIGAMTIVVSVISAVAWVANKLAKKKKANTEETAPGRLDLAQTLLVHCCPTAIIVDHYGMTDTHLEGSFFKIRKMVISSPGNVTVLHPLGLGVAVVASVFVVPTPQEVWGHSGVILHGVWIQRGCGPRPSHHDWR